MNKRNPKTCNSASIKHNLEQCCDRVPFFYSSCVAKPCLEAPTFVYCWSSRSLEIQYPPRQLIFHYHGIHLSKELPLFSSTTPPDSLLSFQSRCFLLSREAKVQRLLRVVRVMQRIQRYALMTWKVWIRLRKLNLTETVQPRQNTESNPRNFSK